LELERNGVNHWQDSQ